MTEFFTCEKCGKVAKTKQALERHAAYHEDERPFSCEKCNQRFKNSDDLGKHHRRLRRDGKLDFACQPCHKHFKSADLLSKHQSMLGCKNDLGETRVDGLEGSPLENGQDGSTDNGNDGEKDDQPADVEEQKMPSPCVRCLCKTCGAAFDSAHKLKSHYVEVHNDKKKQVCRQCGVSLSSKDSLTRHYSIFHQSDFPFQCELCDQKFKIKEGLCRHIKFVHKDGGYTCNVCHRTFTQPANLTKHMTLHSGRRDFVCDYCGRQFTWKQAYTKHVKWHERNSAGLPKVKCELTKVKTDEEFEVEEDALRDIRKDTGDDEKEELSFLDDNADVTIVDEDDTIVTTFKDAITDNSDVKKSVFDNSGQKHIFGTGAASNDADVGSFAALTDMLTETVETTKSELTIQNLNVDHAAVGLEHVTDSRTSDEAGMLSKNVNESSTQNHFASEVPLKLAEGKISKMCSKSEKREGSDCVKEKNCNNRTNYATMSEESFHRISKIKRKYAVSEDIVLDSMEKESIKRSRADLISDKSVVVNEMLKPVNPKCSVSESLASNAQTSESSEMVLTEYVKPTEAEVNDNSSTVSSKAGFSERLGLSKQVPYESYSKWRYIIEKTNSDQQKLDSSATVSASVDIQSRRVDRRYATGTGYNNTTIHSFRPSAIANLLRLESDTTNRNDLHSNIAQKTTAGTRRPSDGTNQNPGTNYLSTILNSKASSAHHIDGAPLTGNTRSQLDKGSQNTLEQKCGSVTMPMSRASQDSASTSPLLKGKFSLVKHLLTAQNDEMFNKSVFDNPLYRQPSEAHHYQRMAALHRVSDNSDATVYDLSMKQNIPFHWLGLSVKKNLSLKHLSEMQQIDNKQSTSACDSNVTTSPKLVSSDCTEALNLSTKPSSHDEFWERAKSASSKDRAIQGTEHPNIIVRTCTLQLDTLSKTKIDDSEDTKRTKNTETTNKHVNNEVHIVANTTDSVSDVYERKRVGDGLDRKGDVEVGKRDQTATSGARTLGSLPLLEACTLGRDIETLLSSQGHSSEAASCVESVIGQSTAANSRACVSQSVRGFGVPSQISDSPYSSSGALELVAERDALSMQSRSSFSSYNNVTSYNRLYEEHDSRHCVVSVNSHLPRERLNHMMGDHGDGLHVHGKHRPILETLSPVEYKKEAFAYRRKASHSHQDHPSPLFRSQQPLYHQKTAHKGEVVKFPAHHSVEPHLWPTASMSLSSSQGCHGNVPSYHSNHNSYISVPKCHSQTYVSPFHGSSAFIIDD